jgi:hypothetical protein
MSKQAKIFLTTTELAARWGLSVGTLKNWRSLKRGPKYLKHGKANNGKAIVRYCIEDIKKYEEHNTHGKSNN